jgi:hypothetical protein
MILDVWRSNSVIVSFMLSFMFRPSVLPAFMLIAAFVAGNAVVDVIHAVSAVLTR